jgi:hypothetical protein
MAVGCRIRSSVVVASVAAATAGPESKALSRWRKSTRHGIDAQVEMLILRHNIDFDLTPRKKLKGGVVRPVFPSADGLRGKGWFRPNPGLFNWLWEYH